MNFQTDEIISSREVAEIFLSLNQPREPLGVLGNSGDNLDISNLSCIELEPDIEMFDRMGHLYS